MGDYDDGCYAWVVMWWAVMTDKVYLVVQSLMLFTVIPKGPPDLLPVPRKTRSCSVKNVADAKFAGKTTPAH